MKRIQLLNMMLLLLAGLVYTSATSAVTGRHPTGVNVNANGVTTVLITYHNVAANEQPVDAFWCGDVTATGVVVGTNPCVSGTLLGHLPPQYDLAQIGGGVVRDPTVDPDGPTRTGVFKTAVPRNMTDVMSIPTAVIRRAYQQAQAGNSSEFFYVRQFQQNGVNTYVTVTCRMAGGGARTPLALTRVDLSFKSAEFRQPITYVSPNGQLPELSAEISYNGSGLLKGRWEIVTPGDVEPTPFDLLTEASVQPTDRARQRRYLTIGRFQKMLNPVGKTVIQGPDPKRLPTLEPGLYRILLRIEASNDVDSRTDTTAGVLYTGGVAGFPMPTIRYFVGNQSDLANHKSYAPVELSFPLNNKHLNADSVIFRWKDLANAEEVAVYRIEFYNKSSKQMIAEALVKPDKEIYKPTTAIQAKLSGPILWRLVALDKTGKALSESMLREVRINNLTDN